MRTLRGLLAALLALCLLPVAALATVAEPPAIGIQLNGESLEFKSGVDPWLDPETNRTFVPFRDLFEAMGATVDYHEETRMITAIRGDTTVSFSQDGTDLIITQGTETRTLQSDVKPVTREGRTLVPIRFASEALGASVGWDQQNQTVLVADVPTLVAQYEGSYELLAKLSNLGKPAEGKNHAMDVAYTMDMTTTDPEAGALSMPMNGSMSAIMSAAAMDATMSMTIDMAALMEAAMPGFTGDAKMTYDFEVIFNMATGVMYLQSDMINQSMELDAGVWISLSLSDLLGEAMPLDFASFTQTDAVDAMLAAAAYEVELNSVDDFAAVTAAMDAVGKLFDDASFVKDGNTYTNTFNVDENGTKMTYTVKLELDDDGNAVASDLSATLSADGAAMDIKGHFDANSYTATFKLESAEASMEMEMKATITETDKAPRTALPQGATSVDLAELVDLSLSSFGLAG